MDLDFETTNRAAPAPTEEATNDIEALIKQRVAEGRWDDVVRVVPPPMEEVGAGGALWCARMCACALVGSGLAMSITSQGTRPAQSHTLVGSGLATSIIANCTRPAHSQTLRCPPPLPHTQLHAPPQRRKTVEMDDTQDKGGLGELYAQQFTRQAAGGTAEDKQAPLREQAKALWTALAARLDALSRFHYAPKPVVEELAVGLLWGP